MYGMQKTTVYLPDELKKALARSAAARGLSEAELIREALRAITAESPAPRPRLPLFASGRPDLAEHVDSALDGFGET
jgi:plasmid stability protein